MLRFATLLVSMLVTFFCINIYADDTTTTITTTPVTTTTTPVTTTTTPVTVVNTADTVATPTVALPNSTIVVTSVPAPKETIAAPQGYSYCFTVKAGWFNQVWIPEHTVCQYDQTKVGSLGGIAWVEGYWACTKFKSTDASSAECTNWDWKPGRWVKTLAVY